VEKMIKGVIAKRTDEFPPRLHNLIRLAERGGLELEEERLNFFGELSSYYIQTRYPEQIEVLLSNVSQELAQEILTETEDTIRWLSSMI
jgi:HEPN domain-containing protein